MVLLLNFKTLVLMIHWHLQRPVQMTGIEFPTPYLSKGIKPKTKGDEDKLAGAVTKMLEEDKTLDFKVDNKLSSLLLLVLANLILMYCK